MPERDPVDLRHPRSPQDLAAGLIFVGVGLVFGIGSTRYELGTLLAMGPGYFPLLVAVLLVGLGTAVVVKAYLAPDTVDPEVLEAPAVATVREELGAREPGAASPQGVVVIESPPAPAPVPLWRPLGMITLSVVFFALAIDYLGLLPTTFGTALVAVFSRAGTPWRTALLTAGGLTVLCYLIFVIGLQVRVDLFPEGIG